ncbi:MAG: host attachment family protein [Croceibacterium sp.]
MKIAHDTLVMVADGEKMMLFRNEGDEKYPVLQTVSEVEQPHAPTREEGSDRPGRTMSSTGSRRSAYGDTDWHQQDEDHFAVSAAKALEKRATGLDAGIVVLAPPRTLGVLRKHWGRQTRARLLAEIHKDFTHHTTDDVIAAITAEPGKAT